MVHAIGQADLFEQRLGQLAGTGAGLPVDGVVQRHEHVVEGRGAGQQVETLEHESEFAGAHQGPFIRREAAHFLAVEPKAARAWAVEAAENIHQGGFAGARSAHQGDHFAAVDAEGNVFQDRHIDFAEVVGFGDIFEVDQAAGDVDFAKRLMRMSRFRARLGQAWRAHDIHR